MKLSNLYPIKSSRYDFEIDGTMIIRWKGEVPEDVPARAWGQVLNTRAGEPVFELTVNPNSVPDRITNRLVSNLIAPKNWWVVYRIPFSVLGKVSLFENDRAPTFLRIDANTRQAMLVWWDQNVAPEFEARQIAFNAGYTSEPKFDEEAYAREEGAPESIAREWFETEIGDPAHFFNGDDGAVDVKALAKETKLSLKTVVAAVSQGYIADLAARIVSLRLRNPSRAEVARQLQLAGLRSTYCGENADWSVAAWYLGPPPGAPSLGANRTEGGLYLIDTEEEARRPDGLHQTFNLVRRYYGGDNGSILDLAEGTLAEMVAHAPQYL